MSPSSEYSDRNDEFTLDDFFETEGSLAVKPEEPVRRRKPAVRHKRAASSDRRGRSSAKPKSGTDASQQGLIRQLRTFSESVGYSRERSPEEKLRRSQAAAQMKNKFSFFLCIGLVLAGAMSVILMYVQVYTANNRVNDLKNQVTEMEEENYKAKASDAGTMNMTEIYVYATDTLGMQEADQSTTITVRTSSSSYTTSNLPVSEIGESKVVYHWFH